MILKGSKDIILLKKAPKLACQECKMPKKGEKTDFIVLLYQTTGPGRHFLYLFTIGKPLTVVKWPQIQNREMSILLGRLFLPSLSSLSPVSSSIL